MAVHPPQQKGISHAARKTKMTKITLDLTKSIEENAAAYFERAKKVKKKVAGGEAALYENLKKMEELEHK